MEIIKRNGVHEEFRIEKVFGAVASAFKDVHGTEVPETLKKILIKEFYELSDDILLHIEEIQDIIENCLMKAGYYDVARSYILYRNAHRDMRVVQERVSYIDSYTTSAENAATSSETDANANVSIKNVANLDGEVYKTLNRQIQRYRMRKKLQELYPEVAVQYEKDIESHIIYIHDEASSPAIKNYCEAVSLHMFMQNGTAPLDGLASGAPKNLSSFAGQFCNLVFLLSSQCKGAVAFGEFFNAMDYYIRKEYGDRWPDRINEQVMTNPSKSVGQMIRQYFQQIVYTINQPAGNRSYQSPFTNISYYDSNYWKAMFGEYIYPDGTIPQWETISFLQKYFMEWFNEERTKTLLTFPVETMALLTDGKDVMDKEYKDFTAEMYAKGHSFFTYLSDNPNGLASCCRLRNEIKENVFSFTSGLTGVQTGSANVITLNINRIVQDWAIKEGLSRAAASEKIDDEEGGFSAYLEEILDRVYKYHIAFKSMLYETENAGMLNASTAGYISMSKLYSTVGVNGVNEAAEFLGMECTYNERYKNFCRLVTGTISKQNKLHSKPKFLFNQEFVPAEGLGSKNYRWDKEDGYWVPEGRVLYNSYFYLADDPETTVLDKFRLHGREFTELLDGGVGLHCNLSEHLSKSQYLKLIDFAIAQGTSYFTFNIPNSECTNDLCRHIVKAPLDTCPKCGKRMRQWTRIIGYLRPVDNFDKYRQIEAKKRYYSTFPDHE